VSDKLPGEMSWLTSFEKVTGEKVQGPSKPDRSEKGQRVVDR
jgi:hypothetical protein